MVDVSTAESASLESKITADDIAAYQRDGAIVLRNILSIDDLALLERGVEEIYNAPRQMAWRQDSAEGQGGTTGYQMPNVSSPSLREFLARGVAGEIAARMMGVPSAHFILDQLFYKEAGHVLPTPWHQDTPYLRVRGNDLARLWFTCDPSPRELTVQLVRGSHRWNVVYDTASLGDVDVTDDLASAGGRDTHAEPGLGGNGLPLTPDIERYRDSFDILSWEVEPGDVLVFNGNMLHGAAGLEQHPIRRRAYASLWGGPDLRHHRPPETKALPSLAELAGEEVPHGVAIGDYPDAFPIYWPRQG